jgi:flagellar hook assembly protein FlgD/PKD repeat protein
LKQWAAKRRSHKRRVARKQRERKTRWFRAVSLLLLVVVAPLVAATAAYGSELAISGLSPDRYFSPNGDNQDDSAYVNYTLSTPATVTIVIRDKGGTLIKTIVGGIAEGEGGNSFSWNGREENNSPAPNGVYKYTIKAINAGKEEAAGAGQIGLTRGLPGTVTRPTPEATISGTTSFVFMPTAGENISSVSFYGRCPSYPYYCLLGNAITPELDGTFAVESEVGGLSSGSNEISTYVSYTDPFGQEHSYSAPVVPVTVAYPEKISNLSPNRYFYPNGSGQEEKASVGYSLSTAAKVTVVLRNSKNEVIRELLHEAEQTYGGSFEWDGTDAASKPASPGVYAYTITAAGSFGAPATASGKIGLDRNIAGTVTKPESGATLTGSETFIFKPTSGENVTGATFYAQCPGYPYMCYLGSALGPEPDGTFDVTAEVGNLASGSNEVHTYVSFVDPFGQEHSYTAPAVPVTVAYPEQISNPSPDRYFYPNGSGEETASVSYGLSTAAKVTVVLRNSKNEVVRTILKEAEQGPGYASFEWDGTDSSAKPVPNGVYSYTVTAAGNYGPPASANGKIGVDRNLPGKVSKPASGETLSETSTFVFTPNAGENISNVYFYARCPSYPYNCYLGLASTPESDGTFVISDDVKNLTYGANEVSTGVSFTDPFGQQHGYSPAAVPVTIAYPEEIASLSDERYLYPNAGETAVYPDYTLSTPAKVTAVLRNSKNEVVRELLHEAEQREGENDFEWDGTDAGAKPAPDGIYTYTITAVGGSGSPATATGKIGLDHNVPGIVTTPAQNATLHGLEKFVVTPTPGETVTDVGYYSRCPSYPYTCFLGHSTTAEGDGTFVVNADVNELTAGNNEVFTYIRFTDAFGEEHYFSAPPVPVTVNATGQTPTLDVSATPTSGKAPLKSTFTIEASQPEEHPLTYTINYGDGGAEQSGAIPGSGKLTLEHTYTQAGVDKAAIAVFDEHGGFAERTVTVTVSSSSSGIPVNALAPTITGIPVEGETLTEAHGLWSGEPTSYQLQWLRCSPQGTGCKPVSSQTGATYFISNADLGHTLEVKEIAKNTSGPGAPAFSNHTELVTVPKPVNKKPPTISGPPTQGATLTEEHGEWSGEPTDYRYQWLQCSEAGTGCAPIANETGSTYVTTAHDLGHTIAVEETAINGGGSSSPAVSKPTAPITAAAPVNLSPPSIVGDAQNGQTLVEQHGSWRNQPTSYAYQWLRCNTAGEACSHIPGAVNQTYILGNEDLHHTINVEEFARNAAGLSAPALSASSPTITSGPLRASAGENISTIAGLTVKLDGSGSFPASDIQSYKWDFGDGTNAEGVSVTHAYSSAGEYTATLTVTRDTESAGAQTKVIVAPPPAHEATILVTDTAHTPLAGADVVYIGPSGARIQAQTGSDGKAALPLPNGADTVYAYKGGFQPRVGHVAVSGGAGEETIVLAGGEIATSTLKSHEMDIEEIEEAGIDTNDPANQNVWEFEVRLAFIESPTEPLELHCYINKLGEFVGLCTGGGGGGGGGVGGWGGGGPSCSPGACVGTGGKGGGGVVAVPKIVDNHPLIEWLILRGKASVLKQFFTVAMVTQNLSSEPFKLAKGQATLNIPAGLSLAPTDTPQTLTQDVPAIPGNGSATTEWIVRGDAPGDYFLSAAYHGQLEPFEAPVDIQAVLADPLHIYGSEALSLSVQADSGKLKEGVPYHVRVGITNKATIPLYNVEVEIFSDVHANFVFQPQQQFSTLVDELKPGETIYAPTDILVPDADSVAGFNPVLSSAHFVGEEIHPGEGIEAVTPPPVYEIESVKHTDGAVHLRWQSVPDAEGYEVFRTSDLTVAFPAFPLEVSETPHGPLTTSLDASATDAYVTGSKGEPSQFYAVSAVVKEGLKLELPVIPAVVGSNPCSKQPGGILKRVFRDLSCIGSEVKDAAACAVSIGAQFVLPTKYFRAIKEAQTLTKFLKLLPSALKPIGTLVYTVYHTHYLTGAPKGFRSGQQLYHTFRKLQHWYEVFDVLPNLEKALDKKDYDRIARDIFKLAGLGPCLDAIEQLSEA